MSTLYKIFLATLAISYMALASVCVYGQNKLLRPKLKQKQSVSLGFQSGRELLFHSSPLIHSRQSKVHYSISNTLFLRKPVNTHFKIETGIKYSAIQNIPVKINGIGKESFIIPKTNRSLSIPVTIQYYFLPENSRIHPYCGAGLQYNINGNGNISPFKSEIHSDDVVQNGGTKYISILFTQGITFEINTKIQLNQSFHFIPGSTDKTIGIDIGIGFNIP